MNWSDFPHDLIGQSSEHILWWQMCLRGVLIFFFGLLLFRLAGRRAFGKRTALDIVLAFIIGSNLSRALTANAAFFPTLAATATLVLIYWIFDHIAARSHWFSRLVKGDPIWLMRGGELDRRKMVRAGVSEGDVTESARSSGKKNLSSLDEVVLERSGDISTVGRD